MPRRPLSFRHTERGVAYSRARNEQRLAEQGGKFVKGEYSMTLQIYDKDVMKALEHLRTNAMRDWNQNKVDIITNASKPMIDAIKPQIPVYRFPEHYRYIQSKKSTRRIKVTYKAGHLRNSIKVINPFKPRLRRQDTIVIGPLKQYPTKMDKGPFDGINKSDAYYANFVFGGANEFRNKALLQGFIKAEKRTGDIIIRGAERIIERETRSAGLTYTRT
jgi:hypothetical protein